jgi:hypothetical protein
MNQPQPEIRIVRSPSELVDAERARVIAESEAKNMRVLQVHRVPGIPYVRIDNPFSEIPMKQTVSLTYESEQDQKLVRQAQQAHADLIEHHGPDNVLAVRPSLDIALAHGHLFPDELVALMVRVEPAEL